MLPSTFAGGSHKLPTLFLVMVWNPNMKHTLNPPTTKTWKLDNPPVRTLSVHHRLRNGQAGRSSRKRVINPEGLSSSYTSWRRVPDKHYGAYAEHFNSACFTYHINYSNKQVSDLERFSSCREIAKIWNMSRSCVPPKVVRWVTYDLASMIVSRKGKLRHPLQTGCGRRLRNPKLHRRETKKNDVELPPFRSIYLKHNQALGDTCISNW